MTSEGLRKERLQRGWVKMGAALLALVAVGFFGGALVGFLWEEPRLVIAYLSGETEAADWSDPMADVAAPPPPLEEATPAPPAPEAKPEASPAPAEPAAKPAPKPAPKVVAKPAPKPAATPPPSPAATGAFAVQVGAFAEHDAAKELVAKLKERGYPSYVSPAGGESARWRVRVGPVAQREDAEALASKLEQREKLPTWVLDENRS